MVTTDEDNVVRGTITESDRLGNVKTYVEVGVERVTDVVEGRQPSTVYPVALVIVAGVALATSQASPLTLAGIVALILLVWWLR